MAWWGVVMALLAGAANPFQSGTNAELNKQLGAPVWATVVVYGTGLLGVLVVLAFTRERLPAAAQVMGASWWAWLGGLISIASTMAGLILAQKLGSGVFTGLSLTASLAMSVVLDQMGWIGFKQHSASPARIAGCALMVAGVWMVSRF